MKRYHHSIRTRYIKGFSLIELMVSITIGLVIMVASLSAYTGASGATRMAEAQGLMNEDAQAALTILTQQLRMAGSNPDQTNRSDPDNPTGNAIIATLSSRRNPVYTPTPTYVDFALNPETFILSDFRIRGCDGEFSNITDAINLDSLNCAGGITASPDSIAVNYEADRFNTIPTSDNSPTDCLGNALDSITATLPSDATAPNPTYAVADNRFYINTEDNNLQCKGNGGSTQPLVENIEDMQFKYGTVAAATADELITRSVVAGYLDANEMDTEDTLETLTNAARWRRVITVRICVLVRSEHPVVTDVALAKYRDCHDELVDAPDLHLRRAYTTTVVLRNRRS